MKHMPCAGCSRIVEDFEEWEEGAICRACIRSSVRRVEHLTLANGMNVHRYPNGKRGKATTLKTAKSA